MLIDICIKFLSGFQVIERTRIVTDRQTDRQTDARGKTKLKGGDIMKELEWSQDFPIITLWELSVAMETRVLIRSYPKPNVINPPTQ